MAKSGQGAKSKLARLQGRKERSCVTCGDEAQLTTCATCGDILCRDCKMDHSCTEEPIEPMKA